MCDKVIRDLNEDPDSPKIFACEYIVVELDDDDSNMPSEFDRVELLSLLEPVSLVNEGPPGLQDDEKEEMMPLVQEVSSILFECDPMCVEFGTNSDEYDLVADTVVLLLKHKETVDDVIGVIIASIKQWFSSDLSNYKTNDKFISMSKRIWTVWSGYQNKLKVSR
jgi:hypothetical protein